VSRHTPLGSRPVSWLLAVLASLAMISPMPTPEVRLDRAELASLSEFHIFEEAAGGGPATQVIGTEDDRYPTWSPDGQTIAFAANDGGENNIYLADSTGANVRALIAPMGDSVQPNWSPDGMQIAFASKAEGPYNIWIVNADGTGLHRFTDSTSDKHSPAWSPDGAHIAFSSLRRGRAQVVLKSTDGTDLRQLTYGAGNHRSPAWSPDGSSIAFSSDRSGNDDIRALDLVSGSVRRITSSGANDRSPAWSPDGSSIAFVSDRSGPFHVYTKPVAGGPIAQITTRGEQLTPTWSPDGSLLIFSSSSSPTGNPSDDPGWIVFCNYAAAAMDDPIVFPGQPGASHLHDFIGNTTVNANSTYDSMRAGSTNCAPSSGDTAGYWAPSLYLNGEKVDPHGPPPTGTEVGYHARQQIYYRNILDPSVVVQPIPADLRVVVGNSHATSVSDNYYLGREIYWGCSDNSPDEKLTAPTDCDTGIISLHVGFPQCWDGVNLDTTSSDGSAAVNPYTSEVYANNHFSHMAYPVLGPSRTYVCPTDHPVPIPRVIMRLEYPIGTSSSDLSLSSGPTYTVHGDFWNTWDQARLEGLVSSCTNARLDCGEFTLPPDTLRDPLVRSSADTLFVSCHLLSGRHTVAGADERSGRHERPRHGTG
jgi:hypothetical protein